MKTRTVIFALVLATAMILIYVFWIWPACIRGEIEKSKLSTFKARMRQIAYIADEYARSHQGSYADSLGMLKIPADPLASKWSGQAESEQWFLGKHTSVIPGDAVEQLLNRKVDWLKPAQTPGTIAYGTSQDRRRFALVGFGRDGKPVTGAEWTPLIFTNGDATVHDLPGAKHFHPHAIGPIIIYTNE